ncbi:MAG: putative TetR-family transcriptional regulator [Frankiales bacterium]|nr:putative TetR-family transcriptional regulator [Frankiales bacterium]
MADVAPLGPPDPPRTRRRRARGSLTPQVVLAGARTLVERDGLRGLSMPALARQLDCGVMSLYSHFRSKDDLLAGLADLVMRELHQHLPPAGDGPWDREVVTYFAAYRGVMEQVPAYREVSLYAPALVVEAALTRGQLRRLDTGVGLLLRAGLTLADASQVYNVCLNYTRSFVAFEHGVLSNRDESGPHPDVGDWRPAALEDYPVLRQLPDVGRLLRFDDAGFELGLELLVDGVATRYGLPRGT